MPRRGKRKFRPPQFWELLTKEQQGWYREWFIPIVVNDTSRAEFHLMGFEIGPLLIIRGHHHTDARRVQTFCFPTNKGTFDITKYLTNHVVEGYMFRAIRRDA